MHHYSTTAFAAVLAASTASAQSVGVTLSALTPLPITATDGINTTTVSWPAGAMPNSGSFCAISPNVGFAGGCADWQLFATNNVAQVRLTHSLSNANSIPSFQCQAGPHEFLMTFTSASSRNAKLDFRRTTTLTAGTPWPSVMIDVDNNGVFEVNNLSAVTGALIPVTFGPQPLLVRVVVDVAISGQAGASNFVSASLLPDNNLTIATPVLGCNPISPPPQDFLQPSFDNLGVDLRVGNTPSEPAVIVIGLNAQPQLLSINGLLPCLLLPTPDVVIFAPGGMNLALPASVRPVSFFAQGVTLTQSGLRVTDGYAVTAN
jgi:hypothetical protein